MDDVAGRIRAEWPAALAVLVLLAAHVTLTLRFEQEQTPLGIPLIAAIVVFLCGELVRRLR